MSIYIKIDDKEAFNWFAKLIENTLAADPNNKALNIAYNQIKSLSDSIKNSMTEAELLRSELVAEHVDQAVKKYKESQKAVKKKPARKATARKKKPEANPYQCAQHPNYGAVYAPRSDCDSCWELYKQFHPLDYPQKRRNFERKLKQK